MLQKLSYFNLLLAMIYLLVYLRSGNFNSTTGILVVIVFNWLYLRSYQLDHYGWKGWHYLIALWCIYFIGTIGYGVANIIGISVETNFISNDTVINLLISSIFSISVLLHIIGYWLQKNKESKG